MLFSRAARVAAALFVSAMVVVGLPHPALAAEPYVSIFASIDAQALPIGTAGKAVGVRYGAYSVYGATLPGTVTVKVDVTGASGVLTAQLGSRAPGCSASGGVSTCTKNPSDRSGVDGDFDLVLRAGASAKVNDSAPVKLTVTAPGVETWEFTYELRITVSGPDLRAGHFTRTGDPGGTVTFRPTFKNQGDRTAQALMLTFGREFAGLPDRYSNCFYQPEPGFGVVCLVYNVNIEPGATVRATADMTVKIGSDAPGYAYAYYFASVFDNNSGWTGYWDEWPKGNGAALAFESVAAARETTSDVDFADNQGNVMITTPVNPSDVVAVGASARGKVGETVTVKLGLTNKGPGYVVGTSDGEGSDPDDPSIAAFNVTLPAGVEVTGIDLPMSGDGIFCRGIVDGKYDEEVNKPGRSSYLCLKWSLAVEETHLVTFTVRITGTVTAAGSVVARGGKSDPNTANNTAKVDFGGEEGLPITGVNVALASTVGLLLVAAGFGVYRVARRRRAVFVTG